jgi:hypothetical protein
LGRNINRYEDAIALQPLRSAGISTQVLSTSEMPEPIRQRWSGNPGFEAACMVAASSDEQAAITLLEYTVQNCKICLYCEESFVRPGENVCLNARSVSIHDTRMSSRDLSLSRQQLESSDPAALLSAAQSALRSLPSVAVSSTQVTQS